MSKSHVGMAICFFCGEAKHILLDKQLKPTLEKEMIYDVDPCDKCEEGMKQGFTVFEVSKKEEIINKYPKHMLLNPDKDTVVAFTGRFVVIEKSHEIAIDWANEQDKVILEDEVFTELFGDALNG